MSEVVEESKGELNIEIETIVSRIERLSLTPAPRTSFLVSEQDNNTEQSLKGRRRGFNLDFRVGRGHGGQ